MDRIYGGTLRFCPRGNWKWRLRLRRQVGQRYGDTTDSSDGPQAACVDAVRNRQRRTGCGEGGFQQRRGPDASSRSGGEARRSRNRNALQTLSFPRAKLCVRGGSIGTKYSSSRRASQNSLAEETSPVEALRHWLHSDIEVSRHQEGQPAAALALAAPRLLRNSTPSHWSG